MDKVYVFYKLIGDQYKLEFEGKTVFVEKNIWNNFIDEQHNRKNNGVSKIGGLSVDINDLEKIISQ